MAERRPRRARGRALVGLATEFATGSLDLGPDADPAQRNLLGVMRRLGTDAARSLIECLADAPPRFVQ